MPAPTKIQKVNLKASAPLPDVSTQTESDVCPKCGDSGFILVTRITAPLLGMEHMPDGSYPCEACADKRRAKFVREWQELSRLSSDEMKFMLADIILDETTAGTRAMVEACQEMLDDKAWMLTFTGTSGNAKTVAGIAVVNTHLWKGTQAMYVPLVDALDYIRDAYSKDGGFRDAASESELERIKTLQTVPVLVIDEMQDAKESEWTVQILATMINRRHRDAITDPPTKKTVLISNKPIHMLPSQIQSRLKDGRNRANGKPGVIVNNDKDLRPEMRRR